MTYTDASIRHAYSLSRRDLITDLQRAGVYGPFNGWSRDEIVTCWLDKFGEREVAHAHRR